MNIRSNKNINIQTWKSLCHSTITNINPLICGHGSLTNNIVVYMKIAHLNVISMHCANSLLTLFN
jgi:hypothetical protein